MKKLEQKWQELKLDYDRAEMLLEKARQESEDSPKNINKGDVKPNLKETLTMQLREQEKIYAKFKNVRIFVNFELCRFDSFVVSDP